MILVVLFIAFLQIGALAFGGGYAILPFIQQIVVNDNGWLTIKEMTDVVTISQMTPGPIALNAATFVGTKIYGILGSVVSTTSIVIPQFILMVLLSKLFFSNKDVKFMTNMLKALRPAIAALIFIATLNLIDSSIFTNSNFNFASIDLVALICFVIGAILTKKKVGMIPLIALGGVLGIVLNMIM